MNTSIVSIIIPVFNVEKYLPQCLESVLAQTYTNWECLLVDDGATDNSGRICDVYARKDLRIHVLHKSNGGVSSARNVGLDNVSGEWVLFVDSDDVISKNYIESFHFDTDLEIQGCQDKVIKEKVAEKALLECFNTAPWGKLFKHKIIKRANIRFPEDICYGEDSIFIYEYLTQIKTIRFSSYKNYHYYIYPNSLGHRRHPMILLLRMYEIQYSLYEKILKGSSKRKKFLHDKTLSNLQEAISWYNLCYEDIQKESILARIAKKHLCLVERYLLFSPMVFIKYCSLYIKLKRYL